MVKTPTSKVKSTTKKTPVVSIDRPPSIKLVGRPDEHEIRERAYGIWLEEGQPHGRELAHWQRAHQELQREAP